MSVPVPDSTYDALAWGSHLSALIGCVASTHGDVLEIGIGHFSTPALHCLCGPAGKQLVSLEQNREWHDHFANRFSCDFHRFYHGEYHALLRVLAMNTWSVVFVDESPGGVRRYDSFVSMLPRSEFVVVHDYHLENEEAIKPVIPKHFHVCTLYSPPTLVASQSRPIPNTVTRL